MKATVEAIFEDGVFKPVERLGIPEGERLRLTVETTTRPEHEDLLEPAAHVYRGFPSEEIDEIERIVLERALFFTSTR